ncbi:MAG: ParB/RepB/Spo0J family partition protein [bacterium]
MNIYDPKPLNISNPINKVNICYTSRDLKGYCFERSVARLLDRYGVSYTANPLDSIISWKQHQGKGVDFSLTSNMELEVKNIDGKVFRSWIVRDWIPRFTYHNEKRVVVMNYSTKLSDQCLDLLFIYDINIIYPDSLGYLFRGGNKLVKATSIEKNKCTETVDSEKETGETEKPSEVVKCDVEVEDGDKLLEADKESNMFVEADEKDSGSKACEEMEGKGSDMSKGFNMEIVPIEKLTISKNNPRFESVPDDRRLDEFANSIRRIGLLFPIVVNKRYEILSGSLRKEALIRAGIREAPVIVYDTETMAEKAGLNVDEMEIIIASSSDLYDHRLKQSEKRYAISKLRTYTPRSLAEIASLLGCSEESLMKWMGYESKQTKLTRFSRRRRLKGDR